MPHDVFLTTRAQKDLKTARSYIAKFSPEAAERWYFDFIESLLDLETRPESRPMAPEEGQFAFDLRQYIFRPKSGKPNRALFTIVGNQVRVLAIRRPGQRLITPDDIV